MNKIAVYTYRWFTGDIKTSEDKWYVSTQKVTREYFEDRKANGGALQYELLEDTMELVGAGQVVEGIYVNHC